MLSLFIIKFLFIVLRSLVRELGSVAGVKVEGPHLTISTSTRVKSDIRTRLCRVSSKNIHKLIFARSLHTVERSLANPLFITGLVDAEGSFIAQVVKYDSRKLGYIVLVSFELALNVKDRLLLNILQETLGNVGNIYYNPQDNTYKYKVSNLEGLINFVIPHFQKYPLLTQKRVDFELFVKIIQIINRKEHLTIKGLQEIINLKASLNLGLPRKLLDTFKVVPVERPKFDLTFIPDPA